MNFDNLPGDKNSVVSVLNTLKREYEDLLEEFEGDSSVSSFVFGTIHNEIEIIDRCLEFGVDYAKAEQYEAEAKADNFTSEQFPNV